MKRQRLTLPAERPSTLPLRRQFRAHWPALMLLCLPALLGFLWRALRHGQWGALIPMFISIVLAHIVWDGLLARTTQCNSSTYHRSVHTTRYWLTMALWILCYLTMTTVTCIVPF